MSLVMATHNHIVGDSYFARDGEPRRKFKKIGKVESCGYKLLYGFVGDAGTGELMADRLSSEFSARPAKIISWMRNHAIRSLENVCTEESLKGTTMLVVIRDKEGGSQLVLWHGIGGVSDISHLPYFAIGYSPAVSFATGYMEGSGQLSISKAVSQTCEFIDFVAHPIYTETFKENKHE